MGLSVSFKHPGQGGRVPFIPLKAGPAFRAIIHLCGLVLSLDTVSSPDLSPGCQSQDPSGSLDIFPWGSLGSLTPAVFPYDISISPQT